MSLAENVNAGGSTSLAVLPGYQLYGLTIGSCFPFTHHLTTSCAQPDLIFECVDSSPVEQDWQDSTPLFPTDSTSELNIYFYAQKDFDVLRLPGTGDFYIWSDRIICHLDPEASLIWLEIQLLGTVLSFWLERRGVLAIHASAVVLDHGDQASAVGFMATSQGGKSSLAAAMVQSGCPLLTDDILPVEYFAEPVCGKSVYGRPGYAQMRLWPDQAAHFVGDYHNLLRVYPEVTKRRVPIGPNGWGRLCDVPQPIGCLYLPERRDSECYDSERCGKTVEIQSVSRRDAVIELVRESFAAPILQAMGILPQRLALLSKIVQHVPVRRLIYPDGVSYLPQVCQAIQLDSDRGFSDEVVTYAP